METGHGYTRGQTIVDQRADPIDHVRMPHSIASAWVDVALGVDARGYAALWLDTLLS